MLNPGLPNFQGSKTSSQSRHMHNKGKITKGFSYMGQNVKKFAFLAIRGLGVPSIIRLGISCFPAILSPISIYICNIEAIR